MFEGALFEETKGETMAQIARRIRADIARAVKGGNLPRGAYSVRRERADIRIEWMIEGFGALYNEDRINWEARHPHAPLTSAPVAARAILSPSAVGVCRVLERIANAYNRDTSDFGSDYHNRRYSVDVRPARSWAAIRRVREERECEETREATAEHAVRTRSLAEEVLASEVVPFGAVVRLPEGASGAERGWVCGLVGTTVLVAVGASREVALSPADMARTFMTGERHAVRLHVTNGETRVVRRIGIGTHPARGAHLDFLDSLGL